MMITYQKSAKIENVASQWQKVTHLYNGTESMREEGKTYLPQEPDETDASYKIRLNRSVLFNKYKRTIETSVGKIFSKPMVVKGLPAIIEPDLENIDSEHSTFNVFSKLAATNCINYGVTYIVVDSPLDGEGRPYWVHINPLAVLDISVDFINGIETLTKFEFIETVTPTALGKPTDSTGGATKEQRKIFYLEEDMSPWFVVLDESGKEVASGPILNGAGQPMSRIPVVPVYGEKIEPYLGSPVLMDLAELNLAHWQDYSDLRNINHITSVPMLMIKGNQANYDENGKPKQITISPNSVIDISDPQGDAKWVEHSGSSISTNHTMLESLEAKMSVMGLEMTADMNKGGETATGRVIDAAETHSKLKCIALDLESSLENALQLHSEYVGVMDADIQVIVNTTFSEVTDSADMVQVLTLYKDGIINAEAVLEEAKKRLIVSDNTSLREGKDE